ncbi:MAG: type VII secretion protein EccB [Haloechinothrix sp.]
MPSTPTTKSQVQAYRFVLRRMQSALVRKDAVMLHDPMQTHSRATAVGVIVAVIGMLGFLVFGILKPAAPVPNSGIVIGKESGQIYVKTEATASAPAMLIPTFNLASARLILMGNTQQGEGGAAPGGAPQQVDPVQPDVVPDDRLKDIPRGRLQGIPDGPPLLPDDDQRIEDHWAVCDHLQFRNDLTDQENLAQTEPTTAVLSGVADLGEPLGRNQAIFAKDAEDTAYLIYRPAENANTTSDMVRAEVDLGEAGRSVRTALNLDGHQPREMSTAVLNAIETVDSLTPGGVPSAGEPSPFDLGGADVRIGGVFQVTRTTGPEYFLLLRDGVQPISAAVAEVIRYERSDSGVIPNVRPDVLADLNRAEALEVDHYPTAVPEVLNPLKGYSALCLGWTVTGEGDDQDARTTVYVGNRMPLPKDEDGDEALPFKVGQANPDGTRIDQFFMPPGRAAVVHAATSKESFQSGPMFLISDRGMRYGIPDQATAAHLGLAKQRPAPDAIVRLLPAATMLSAQAAKCTFDSVPIGPETPKCQAQEQAAASGS